ncbi:MAG: DUF1598 domain-containing protein [Planctomycetaceae bacterium]|nr:DUF1598 domain-containing protein [Planctomycetaceae bacterium]
MYRMTLTVCVISLLTASTVFGQGGGNQNGGNQNGGVGGIRIDPDGVLNQAQITTLSSRELRSMLRKSAGESLPEDLNRASEQRMISLRALDLEINRLMDDGQPLPPAIINLAGLTRIDLVSFTDDGIDVIIAGPAEGFAPGPDGRQIGVQTQRPVLCLEDLLIALRTANGRSSFGCSFDPVPERLAKTLQLLQQDMAAANAAAAQQAFQQIGQVLGNWNISVNGVPSDSRMAVTMVEADFMLKRLTTGDANPDVSGFKSYLSMMSSKTNGLQRWWFSPLYESIETNPARTVFRFSGARLQVSAQDELVDADGNRRDAATTQISFQKYAQQFTRKMDALAENVPAIAQLQNTVDVLVTATLIQRAQSSGSLRWTPTVLSDEQRLPLQKFNVPREVPSLVRVRMAGQRTVLGVIAGGVTINPRRILDDVQLAEDQTRLQISPHDAGQQTWWWD